ncbi:MAG: hypothetical protein RL222_945, partial [Bacteroidota bacterium]
KCGGAGANTFSIAFLDILYNLLHKFTPCNTAYALMYDKKKTEIAI